MSAKIGLIAVFGKQRSASQVARQADREEHDQHVRERDAPQAMHIVVEHEANAYDATTFSHLFHEQVGGQKATSNANDIS